MGFVKTTRVWIFAVVILTGIFSSIAAINISTEKDRAKARYFFMKAAVSEAEGELDKAYEYYKKAYQTDPEYADASYAHGFMRTALDEDTFSSREELLKDLRLMRDLVELSPLDIYAAERYGYIAALADTFPESLRVYRKLTKENPGRSQLYIPLAYYHMSVGNNDSAVFAIRELERLEGANTETTVRKVSYWLSKGDTIAAIAETDAYAENNPGNPQVMIDKAMIYNLLGMQDSAITILEQALKEYPEKSELKYDIALIYAEKEDSARFHSLALEALQGSDMEYEDRMDILSSYSKVLNTGSQYFKESDKIFDYMEKQYPQDADFFDLYANYEVLKEDYNKAYEKEKKALTINPDEPSFLLKTMNFSIVAGIPKEGMKIFENYKNDEYKQKAPFIYSYIVASQQAGEYNKGKQWIDTLIKQNNAELSLSSHISSELADSMRKTIEPEKVEGLALAYELAGDIYSLEKSTEDVVRSFENSINLFPSNASVLNNYAYYIVETMGVKPGSEDFDKAKKMSKEALELTAESPQGNYLDTYAWILFKEKNYEEALDYQEMAIEIENETTNSEFYDHYGDILYMNQRVEDALEQWQKASKLDPDNKLLKKKINTKTYYSE